ncbi:hypothetical protein KCU95_g14451, partial [Aureobasidium melanogenum]
MSQRARRRIIACVDGTWYDADGQEGQANGNNTNIFRIFASIGRGAVEGENGETIEQIIEYFPGIGTNEKSFKKWNSGVTGDGYAEQIAEVYKYCCRNIVNPEDDLWFYGFSRGAYVVTVVAVLLETIGALPYDDNFQETYKKAWDLHKLIQKGCLGGNEGKVSLRDDKSRSCPSIGFMGLLDTVKRVSNDPDMKAHTLAFHNPVKHVRHALALNDTRFHYTPELYGPIADSNSLQGRSLIEAWFAGAHSDIGGGARDDGLSLYPLQWLLIESQHHGLVLQQNSQRMLIEDPLSLVFPSRRQDPPTDQDAGAGDLWTYHYANGIKGKSGFLKGLFGRKRSTDTSSYSTVPRDHENADEQSDFAPVRHLIRLHSGFPHILYQQNRNPFKDGKLQGYSERPFGCIIHPSVYLIMDVYARFRIELAMKPFAKDI